MQFITKIDESGTHVPSDSMVMAGYTARLGQWNRFDRKWGKGLRQAGLRYFHAKEHRAHPFAIKGVKIADASLMFGFVVRLDRGDYQKVYRTSETGAWGGKIQPDSMYGLCFRYCLAFVLRQTLIEQGSWSAPVLDFIVENGHVNEGAPNEIVHQLKRKRISGVSEHLGNVTPMDKEKCYGLQAADALATGAWHMEGSETGALVVDIPDAASLADTVPFRGGLRAPIFRCHVDAAELALFKDEYFEHFAHRQRFWHNKTRSAL
jgi:hypothetical protein